MYYFIEYFTIQTNKNQPIRFAPPITEVPDIIVATQRILGHI